VAYQAGDQPIPGYRLDTFLGQGSYGSVWKAIGPGGVPCAMKFISLDNKSGLKEMRAIGLVKRLQHPNLCPVQAIWLKDKEGNLMSDSPGSESTRFMLGGNKELIIAMGLGQKTLAQRLEECRGRGGIPIRDLIRYMEDAAKGIDYLNDPVHDLGSGPASVIHCDIKPANLLIVGGGVQVCDYGVARALSSTGADVRKTFAAGTPAYAPAELINNEPTNQTDQYSLAITYFELRTGHLPFDEAKAIIANLTGQLDLSDLPPDEQEVIRQATCPRPNERYETCLEMVEALKMASGVTITRPARHSGSASGFELPPYTSGPARSTPKPPPSNVRGTPPLTGANPNPRGTDRVRFTPEPPEAYGTSEGVWPPGSDRRPGPSSNPQSESHQSPGQDQRAKTPPAGYLNDQPTEDNGGTISFNQVHHHGAHPAVANNSAFANDPSNYWETTTPKPDSKKRASGKGASKNIQEVWDEADEKKPSSGKMGLLLVGLVLLLTAIGGGGAAYYFLVYKPGLSVNSAVPTTASEPTSKPTGEPNTDSDKLKVLSGKIKELFDKEEFGSVASEIANIEKLNTPDAKPIAEAFTEELRLENQTASLLPDLRKAIKEPNRDSAETILGKIKALNPKRAKVYASQVEALPIPEDVIQAARQDFRNGRLAEGLKRLRDKLSENKLKSDQVSVANKLVSLWSQFQTEKAKPTAKVSDLKQFHDRCIELAKSADSEDAEVFKTQWSLELSNRIEQLLPGFAGLEMEEWKTLLGMIDKDASPAVKALAVEAYIEQFYLSKPSQAASGVDAILSDQANNKFSNYTFYLKGLREAIQGGNPELIVAQWQSKFTGQLPSWLNKHRATRMAAVIKLALSGEDTALAKTRLANWKGFLDQVSKVSGVTFEVTEGLDATYITEFLVPLRNPATAKLDQYATLYTKVLRGIPKTSASISKLSPAKRAEVVKLFTEIGQHLLINSLAWNAVPALQEDKLLAEAVAEKVFTAALSTKSDQNEEIKVWLEIAKLLLPNAKVVESTSEAARGKSDASKLLALLIERAKTRYEGTREVDLKDTVDKHIKINEKFIVLLSGELTPIVAKLATKWAILQGLQLAEIDNGSYFRQEKILKQVAIWTKSLNKSADELFLVGRWYEVTTRLLKPDNRFSRKEPGMTYNNVFLQYAEVQKLVGLNSAELKLSEARATYYWEQDKLSRTDGLAPPINSRVFKETENKLASAIEYFTKLNHSGYIAEANYTFGKIHMLAAKDKDLNNEALFSRFALAVNSYEAGIKAAETLDGGSWIDQNLGGLLLAREEDAKLGISINVNPAQKIELFFKDYEKLEQYNGRAGLKAIAFLVNRRLQSSELGSLPEYTEDDLNQAINKISINQMVCQDAEYLTGFLNQLGVKQLVIPKDGYKSPEKRAETRESIIKSTSSWDKAYKLFDKFPFQSGMLKSNTAGTLGKWYRYLGDVYDMDKMSVESRATFAEAIPALGWCLTCTPLIDDYWAFEVHYGYSLSMYHIKTLDKTDKDFTSKRLNQLVGLAEAVNVLGDADQRIKAGIRSRKATAEEDEGTKSDLTRIKQNVYPKFREFIQTGLSEVSDLTEFQKASCNVSLAEMELSPNAKGSVEKGKQLAREWLPKLEAELQRDTISMSERYLLQRQIGRVKLMAK
jgi:serine/threonine protein kinase